MKKVITLLFACLLVTKVFSGESFHVGYHNYTQNTWVSNVGVTTINVIANLGDSINFWASASCSNGAYNPDQWFFNGDSIQNTAGVYDINVIINQTGMYSADLSSSCFGYSWGFAVAFYVTNITGIPAIKNINFLNVFPTAVNSSITIQLNSIKTNDLEISFYDMNGRQLKNAFYKNIVGEFIKNENTEALAKGIYFLRIKSGNDVVEKKFVKL